ncbi:hypothetical protein [Bacillus bingmayongensis]|uniref:hypothetical protein n=1 Tax=Bacillus bingmayongensis TaxID=1150157 RepID=UPI0035AC10BB
MKRVLLSVILFVFGLGVFLYPPVSNYINHRVYETEIMNYEKRVEKLIKEDINKKFQAMEAYNESLRGPTFRMEDPFASSEKKNTTLVNFIKEDDVLGTVIIPKIKEELPIYLGATGEHLSMGVDQIGGPLFRLEYQIHILYSQDIVVTMAPQCFDILTDYRKGINFIFVF